MSAGNNTKARNFQVWSQEDTKKLLVLYNTFLPQIGSTLRFKNKKHMWSEIAAQWTDKTPKQCEDKYKSVLRRKKSNRDLEHLKYKKGIDVKNDPLNFSTMEIDASAETDECEDTMNNSVTNGGEEEHRTITTAATANSEEFMSDRIISVDDVSLLKAITSKAISKERREEIREHRHLAKMKAAHEIYQKLQQHLKEKVQQQNNEANIYTDLLGIYSNNQSSNDVAEEVDVVNTEKVIKTTNIQAALIQIAIRRAQARELKEKLKERRHREKMEAVAKLEKVLEKILQREQTN